MAITPPPAAADADKRDAERLAQAKQMAADIAEVFGREGKRSAAQQNVWRWLRHQTGMDDARILADRDGRVDPNAHLIRDGNRQVFHEINRAVATAE